MKDSGIEEVRLARQEISEECGHDLHKVAAYYRRIETELRESDRYHFEEMPSDARRGLGEGSDGSQASPALASRSSQRS